MRTTTASEGGIGFLGFLTLLFIALKLIGVITWSWLWVLAPLWFPTAILFAFIACFLGVVVVFAVLYGLAVVIAWIIAQHS